MEKLLKGIIREYWKSALVILVQAVSIKVIYDWLVSFFYLQNFTIPRSIVVIFLLLVIWGFIRFRRLSIKLKSYQFPKLSEDQEYILSMHKDLPLGNGQCASTLLEGQDKAHLQEAQYHLDVLNDLKLIEIINPSDLDDEEPLYQLTKLGRKYLYENRILYKEWGA